MPVSNSPRIDQMTYLYNQPMAPWTSKQNPMGYANTQIPSQMPTYMKYFNPAFQSSLSANNYNIGTGGAYGPVTTGGTYSSHLLSLLSGKIQQDIANPNASYTMGTLQDEMAGQARGAQKELMDRFAGYGRGSGLYQAAQQRLARDLARDASIQMRQALVALDQLNKGLGLDVERLASGLYEQAQQRGLEAQRATGGFYESAQDRALRASLGEAGLRESAANNMTGLMGNLGNFLQSQTNLDTANWQRQDALNRQINASAQQDYDKENQFQKAMLGWKMQSPFTAGWLNNRGTAYGGR
jgi:hypothetical protein